MTDPKLIDQTARDMAFRAVAAIERHEAVCLEAERRRAAQIKDMDEKLSGWLERIQKSYEQSWHDISSRHSNAMIIVNNNALKFYDDQKKVNESLYNRFWLLLWSYAAGVTSVALYLGYVVLTKH